ncbi:MAG: geranylgeranylglycerol-phosphate geranylgeranyltransferase [Chloroflexi bacterium]|nr:geranylgeranylglycerol-phosphate geranylgeranyltransferase [Chloroflexota bacterium]
MSYAPFIRITRPANCLGVGILALASCIVAGAGTGMWSSIILAVSGCAIMVAGGNTLNDAFDLQVDKIVHKERVLPKGEMTTSAARVYALALMIGSPVLFLFVNRLAFLSAAASALLLFFYSWKLKNASGILGNLATALLTSNSVLIGGLVMGNVAAVIPLVFCVFFATLSREIVKDIEDLPGDSVARIRTLPMLVGHQRAGQIAALLACLCVLTAYLPYYYVMYGRFYLVAVTVVNAGMLFAAGRLVLKGSEGIRMTQKFMKAEMFLYVLLFLSAAVLRVTRGV